ncbi:MAG: sulfur oxidation c-type cytochrome SoxA [Alphaproteobacteria bacterium]
MQIRGLMTGLAAAVLSLAAYHAGSVVAEDKPVVQPPEGSPLDELISGYNFRDAATKALQDDDFENPGFLWVEQAEGLWEEAEGEAGKACADCHDGVESLQHAATSYPVYFEPWKKLINLEQRINLCRTEQMKAEPWKYESDQMLGMTALIKYHARDEPVNVAIDGDAAPFFEKGKEFYYERRGQLDMSCANCHENFSGMHIRADMLSQGQSNGFPTYRLKWQGLGSLHRRFKGCNEQVRAEPYERGSDEYVNLELYLAWRGQGLPIEGPSVRQ